LFNEKILGLEFGYGYRAKDLFFNVNLYRTTWTDRFLFENVEIGGERGEANFSGVEQIHSGIEIDGAYDIGPFVTVSAMLSLGNYKYGGNVTDSAVTTNESNVSIGSATLYLDDAKVGDTAHRTSHIDLTVRPTDRFKFNIDMFSAGDLYGSINAEDFDEPGVTNLKLPSYEIFGFGSSYKFELGENPIYLRLNINNLFDNEYYQESANNYLATASTENYKGINVRNRVIPGWGRTWNLGFTYRF
jgi:outer membrane receptor for Fe3+-dicitrate